MNIPRLVARLLVLLVLVKRVPFRYSLFSGTRAYSRHHGAALVLTGVLVLSIVAATFTPFAGRAAAAVTDQDLSTQVLSWASYNGLRKCVRDEGGMQADKEGFIYTPPYIKDENAKSGKWWFTEGNPYWGTTDGAVHNGSYLNAATRTGDRGGDGKTLCNDILKTGLGLWGYSSALDLLCDAGVKRVDGSSCREGTDRFGDISGYEPQIAKAIRDKAYGGQNPQLTDAGKYLLYKSVFEKGCQAQLSQGQAEDKFVYAIKIVGSDRKVQQVRYVAGRDHDTGREINVSDDLSDINQTCNTIAGIVDQTAGAYEKYLQLHPSEQVAGGSQAGKCADGSDPKDGKCPDGSAPVQETGDQKSSCVIDGVGWIVCAGAMFLANVADGVYGLIEHMLRLPPINTKTLDGTNGVYNAWRIMQSFANVAFVIMFLIIIYSHLTNVGISNYSVKKTLPRLIIAAILVNLSFWISALAVDVSNVTGAGIYRLLSGVKDQMGIGISANWGNIITALIAGQGIAVQGGAVIAVGAALAGGAVIAGGATAIMALCFMALGLLLTAVLAVFIVIFMLVARQAIVVILIVLSPLAFVAYLLPNTEKHFKQWRQLLITMLTMYPLVSIIFGGAQIAGLAILSTASSTTDPVSTGVAILVGQLVMVAPFFFLFALIRKFSGSQIESMTANIRNRGKGLIGGVTKLTKPIGQRKLNLAKTRLQNGQFATRLGRNGQETRLSRLGRAAGGAVGGGLNFLGRSKFKDEMRTRAGEAQHSSELNEFVAEHAETMEPGLGKAGQAYMSATAEKAIAEAVGMHQKLLRGKGATEWLRVMKDTSASKEERAAAAGLLASSGSNEQQYEATQVTSDLLARGDSAAGAMQKQMLSEFGSRIPFGMGDQDRAAMMRGEWQGNIYQNLADRSATHSTPEKFANLDIDELRTLADMAQDGGSHGVTLTDEQRAVINDQITAVEKDEILRTKVAKRDRDQYARLTGTSGPSMESGAEISVPHGSGAQPAADTSTQSYPTADEFEAADAAVRAQMRRDGRFGAQAQQQQRQEDKGVPGHGDFMDHLK